MLKISRVYFLLITFFVTITSSNNAVGYVGPACVVVEDLLYLHGSYTRRLNSEEVLAFKKYQNTLSLLKQLKEAVSKGATLLNNGSISLPKPVIPNFCEGFGDDVEVVLDGCVVRQNFVFIDNRLTRELNNVERQKILLVLESFNTQNYRQKRDSQNSTVTSTTPILSGDVTEASPTSVEPSTTTVAPISDELKELLSKYFNVNGNVTDRFLPVAQYSPVVNQLLNRPQLKPFQMSHDDVQDEVQKQRIREFIHDHIMKYQSRSQATTTTTEIPHLMIENVVGPQVPPPTADPFVMQLLQQIQYNRQMELYQQQLQQQAAMNNRPLNPKIPRFPGAAPMKPGDTLEIGDQTYIAVPLTTQSGETVGLVPLTRSSTHTVTMLPPMRSWMRNGASAGPHPEQVRYHPGKRRPQFLQVPTHVNGVPLPHEICRVVLNPSV
ncbi:unnamed protein product [Bursaphelenchus xylophilus]|uniref:(pine wood nematode) hypothetical protein n=1 Tax=Bursaphelenchus xylophilus TaxID=6326 RepID=A0A1I7SVP4_BURXY|nr:unnamed protein product [Bursaphelenchus xylophilus]CAG9098030.1 unnamed protein product [Bursaphelenchus xylophilus]